jgi:hypothetical protein
MAEQFKTYACTCGDKTEGRISATSDADARDRAEEMCQVHGGVQKALERGAK